ncbi:MAG: nucleotide-binding universal stress UspA family protein [Gammaproteobacteria bacterium]|jgi:nucleotide-binding universal stress UspA family protein
MSYKNICVHVSPRPHCAASVKIAFDLAEHFDAHLTGVFVDPVLMSPELLAVSTTPTLFASMQTEVKQRASEAKLIFDEAVASSAVRTQWKQPPGPMYSALNSFARYSDLLIVNQQADADRALILEGFADSAVIETGRPVLVVPAVGCDVPLHGKVLVAWNGSREAARAVNDAMPLLKFAKEVRVLCIDPPVNEHAEASSPGADLCFHLSTHGVKANVEELSGAGAHSGDLLLAHAAQYGANLIVAGAYGHSRMRELVLGGVTLKLLRHMKVPVLMSH